MKILHLIYDHIKNPWVGGGGAVRCYEINKRLAEKGHKITVVSGKFPGAFDYKEGNLEFVFVGSDRNYIISTFSYALKAHRFLKENIHNYDIIIEDFAPWNPVFSYRYQYYKPVIVQIHHKEGINILRKYYFFGIPFLLVENKYPKYFVNVISVSSQTQEKYKVRGETISNGIDSILLKEKKETLGGYLLYIGRIDFYNKGIDLLINAKLDIPVIIAGKGKDEKKLLSVLPENYKFVGFVNEEKKISLIKNARLVIMPSRFEGQGIIALESAAVETPLVVSDIPELKYVTENNFGISFRSGDIEDMKKKIRYLYYNENLIKEMGKNGKIFARNFTWDRIAEKFENYLIKVLKKES